jgi:hypothetical protein
MLGGRLEMPCKHPLLNENNHAHPVDTHMTIPEDVRTRRGEPVIVTQDGREFLGYIEFGDETTRCISVATEPGGARLIVDRCDVAKQIRTDPTGARPLRDARGIKWEPTG